MSGSSLGSEAAAATATPLVKVTGRVYEWLRAKVGTVQLGYQRIVVPVNQGFDTFVEEVGHEFPEATKLDKADWEALFHAIMGPCQAQRQQTWQDSIEPEMVRTYRLRELEFTQPYIGDDVPAEFESYIDKCWKQYCIERSNYSRKFVYPCTTIVQSSGFGKSRLLRELALSTRAKDARMKVLYVCVREGFSSGYPVRTAAWPEDLFPFVSLHRNSNYYFQERLSSCLQTVFHNAMRDWDSVGDYCFAHLELLTQGNSTYDRLTRKIPDTSADQTDQCASFEQRRILVLALDEARQLLETSQQDPTGWFRRLGPALDLANAALARKYGRFAGIFAVLVDTNPMIATLIPSSSSSRETTADNDVLFPPFVLTQTMDVFLDADMKQKCKEGAVTTGSEFYRELVQRGKEEMRNSLADMGRPLWQQYKIAKGEPGSLKDEWNDLLALAACKLVVGQAPYQVTKRDSSSLYGVPALLCRLGIRPCSWSPLASRVVADHMAVLSHVSPARDEFVSSYSSEPILAFGAARVWYESYKVNCRGYIEESRRPLLERLILPKLAPMLHREMLDTDSVGELVARIVLLLAMDTIGVVVSDVETKRCYDGEFYSVATFLRTLSGDSTEVLVGENKTDVPLVDDLLAPWKEWKVGFSHFVQLSTEPSEEVLWAMLARRAACALPRDFGSIDLLIPIFKDSTVSMILIEVNSCENGDSDYPTSALLHTRPGHVFRGDLKETADEDVVRVYMSLRGFESLQQYFVMDPGDERSPGLEGLQPEGGGPTPSQPPSAVTSPTVASSVASLAVAEGETSMPKAGTTQHSSPDAATGRPQRSAREALEPSTTTCPSRFKKYPIVLCVRGLEGWHAMGRTAYSWGKEVCVVSQGVADQLKALLTPQGKLRTLVEAGLEADLHLWNLNFRRKHSEVMDIAMRPMAETVLVNKWQPITQGGHSVVPSETGRAEATSVRPQADTSVRAT
ncbi:hypothetical protein BBJ28_00005673 [Nothophytophthora sp. Chile5]|nr:hypothetical protein BBJ28_00005673 [Nothophytophthora sp. Chile5]